MRSYLPLCVREWVITEELWLNWRPQMGHEKGRSPIRLI